MFGNRSKSNQISSQGLGDYLYKGQYMAVAGMSWGSRNVVRSVAGVYTCWKRQPPVPAWALGTVSNVNHHMA